MHWEQGKGGSGCVLTSLFNMKITAFYIGNTGKLQEKAFLPCFMSFLNVRNAHINIGNVGENTLGTHDSCFSSFVNALTVVEKAFATYSKHAFLH